MPEATTTSCLVASDMDGTVIPLRAAGSRKKPLARFHKAFQRSRSKALAYVTGRHLDLACQGIEEYRLPLPRFIVCDVGTSVYVRRNGKWKADDGYRRRMKRRMGGCTGADVAEALAGTRDLTEQEPERQSEFKRSYYVAPDVERKTLVTRVKRRLSRRGIEASVVFSVDSVQDVGLLDVLPANVAKDFALYYLQRRLGLTREQTVYAGDSGNDLLAFVSGCNAIVVGNTPDRVKEVLHKLIQRKEDFAGKIYFARGHDIVGVLEGLKHFGVLKK